MCCKSYRIQFHFTHIYNEEKSEWIIGIAYKEGTENPLFLVCLNYNADGTTPLKCTIVRLSNESKALF